jgi:hypothetical protein
VRNLFTKTVAVLVIVVFCGLTMVPPGLAQAPSNEESESTPVQYGLGVASVFTSLPYSIGKFVFATMGAIFGGFTWAFSGGNERAANAVWDTSMRGTYVISPRHLKGEEPVRFLGIPPVRDEAPASMSAPPPAPAPAP